MRLSTKEIANFYIGTLERCPQSEKCLMRCLDSLPDTLNETYERMLKSIWEPELAQHMFKVLCCAMRPLTVEEVLDSTSVTGTTTLSFDTKSKLLSPDAIQDVCPGFIEIRPQKLWTSQDDCIDSRTVHLAHFSVQEFLESDWIQQRQGVMCFAVAPPKSHAYMTRVSLTFLLEQKMLKEQGPPGLIISRFPFLDYAAHHWPDHFELIGTNYPPLDQALRLFDRQNRPFGRWLELYNPDGPRAPPSSPIYYASLLGLDQILLKLLDVSPSALPRKLNERTGYHQSALGAAFIGATFNKNRLSTLYILIGNGADLHASIRYGYNYTPLCAALVDLNDLEIAQLLLNKGADINKQAYLSKPMFHAALEKSEVDKSKLVSFFIQNGANMNIKDGRGRTALMSTIEAGNLESLQLLLSNGVDIVVPRPLQHNRKRASRQARKDRSTA